MIDCVRNERKLAVEVLVGVDDDQDVEMITRSFDLHTRALAFTPTEARQIAEALFIAAQEAEKKLGIDKQ